MNLNEYIRTAELAETPAEFAGEEMEIAAAAAEINIADMQAAVNAGSILAFVDGVTQQAKDDVLFSTQFAQLAASAKFDRFLEVANWYRAYVDWLETLGWVVPHFGIEGFDQKEGELEMHTAALAIMGAALAGGGTLPILTKALDVLKGMADDSNQIKLFDFYSSVQFGGNFQMGEVHQAENGALSIALGAFHFKSVDKRQGFLFVRWGKRTVNFWAGATSITLNETLYEQVRGDVMGALGDRAKSRIAGLGPLTG